MTAPTRSDRPGTPRDDRDVAGGDGTQTPMTIAAESSGQKVSQRRLGGWIDTLARRGLHVQVTVKAGTTVLALRGRLDQQTASVLKEGFPEIIALSPRAIDVDLGGVDRVDGMGLAALVWSWGLAREGGRKLRLLHMPAATREIVTRMNLHHVLQVVEDGTFR